MLVMVASWSGQCQAAKIKRPDPEQMVKLIEKLKPLHTKLGKPKPGDWLLSHHEAGQTFRGYIAAQPVVPTDGRRTIYIQPLGEFSPEQRRVLAKTADCIAYECVMCGSNSLSESDRRPIEVCPECLAKLCWATGTDPVQRFKLLEEFTRQAGLDRDVPLYEKSLAALGATSQPAR